MRAPRPKVSALTFSRVIFRYALAGTAAATAGCASGGGAATELELSHLRRDVVELQNTLAEQRATMARLEGQITLLAARNEPFVETKPPADKSAAAKPSASAAHAGLPVVRLRPTKAGATRPPAQVDEVADAGALDDGSPPVMIKLGPDDGEKLPVDHEVLKRPDPVLGKSSAAPKSARSAEDEYKKALAVLREQHNPSEARILLASFRQHHPKSELAENAAYWMAECTYAEERYADAADEFMRLVKEHPASAKIPDALLRAGQSWKKLGEDAKATEVFRRLKDGYPDSEAAGVAQAALTAAPGGEGK